MLGLGEPQIFLLISLMIALSRHLLFRSQLGSAADVNPFTAKVSMRSVGTTVSHHPTFYLLTINLDFKLYCCAYGPKPPLVTHQRQHPITTASVEYLSGRCYDGGLTEEYIGPE